MLDKEGYRPNVGIILANPRNEVFWGKRVHQHAWQFPQGGIKHGETPLQAMYREQKQIWYLLRMTGRDCDVRLRASGHPEFDAWRWHDYWIPLETVIDFKREVYRQALIELHRYLQADHRRARARRLEAAH